MRRRDFLTGAAASSILLPSAAEAMLGSRRVALLGTQSYPLLPLYSSIVGLGDSETAGAAGPDSSYYSQACVLGLGKFKNLNNAGVAGQTSSAIVARIATDVIPYAPAVCSVLMGTNDINQSLSFSNYQANVASAAAQLRAAGIAAVFPSIFPQNSNRVTPAIWNAWLQVFCQSHGCRYVDIYTAISDGSGGLNPAYDNGDGIHLNNAGAIVAGTAFNNGLTNSFPAWPLASSDSASSANLISNAVTLANSGGVPTGFSLIGTGSSAVVKTDAILGNYIELTLASAASGGIQFLTAANWSIGDYILPIFPLVSITGASSLSLNLAMRWVGPSTGGSVFSPWAHNTNQAIIAGPAFQIPATTTSVSWRLFANGSGVVNIYRPTCRNITRAPYDYNH